MLHREVGPWMVKKLSRFRIAFPLSGSTSQLLNGKNPFVFCHVERRGDISIFFSRDLIRSLPVRSATGLPVHVAASPTAPFSTTLGMTERTQKKPGGKINSPPGLKLGL